MEFRLFPKRILAGVRTSRRVSERRSVIKDIVAHFELARWSGASSEYRSNSKRVRFATGIRLPRFLCTTKGCVYSTVPTEFRRPSHQNNKHLNNKKVERMPIVAVSYDSESLNRRITAFQNLGYAVIPASSLASCFSVIALNNYDLLVIGATVPVADRKTIVAASGRIRPEAKIVSVGWPGAKPPVPVDRVVEAGDESKLLAAIAAFARKSA